MIAGCRVTNNKHLQAAGSSNSLFVFSGDFFSQKLGSESLYLCVINLTIIEQLKQRASFVSSTEALGIIGTTRKTLCAWVRKGTINAYRIGNAYVFDPVELAGWIEARRV